MEHQEQKPIGHGKYPDWLPKDVVETLVMIECGGDIDDSFAVKSLVISLPKSDPTAEQLRDFCRVAKGIVGNYMHSDNYDIMASDSIVVRKALEILTVEYFYPFITISEDKSKMNKNIHSFDGNGEQSLWNGFMV